MLAIFVIFQGFSHGFFFYEYNVFNAISFPGLVGLPVGLASISPLFHMRDW